MTAKLSAEELEKLEALAKAATPGPWAQVNRFPLYVVPAEDAMKLLGGADTPERDATYAQVIVKVEQHEPSFEGWERFTRRRFDKDRNKADAAYIAAVNPSAVLALLAQVREAEAKWKDITKRLQAAVAADNLDWAADIANEMERAR